VIGFLAMMFVIDTTPRAQQQSTLLIIVPVWISMLIAALASPYAWLSNALLLLLCFLAYFIRRFGPRFLGIGMVALIVFLFTLLMQVQVRQLPWMFTAGLIGIGCAFFFRFVLFPENLERSVRRTVDAFRSHAAMLVKLVSDSVVDRRFTYFRHRRIHRSINQLYACALAVESRLAAFGSFAAQEGSAFDRLRIALFDTRQSLGTLAETATKMVEPSARLPDGVQRVLVNTLNLLEASLRDPTTVPTCKTLLSDALADLINSIPRYASAVDAYLWAFYALRMEQALRQVAEFAEGDDPAGLHLCVESGWSQAKPGKQPVAAASQQEQREAKGLNRLHPTTILAIQATLAGGLALLVATLLSLDRPYWAAITAIVLISGTFGETFKRAAERSIATLGGLVLGFALAALLVNGTALGLALLFGCIFLQVYTSKGSYAWTTLWSAVSIALLFTTLSGLHEKILVVRLLDTLLGGVVGAIVAALVLPRTTSSKVKAEFANLLRTINNLIRNTVTSITSKVTTVNLVAEARAVDSQLYALIADFDALKYESSIMGYSRDQLQRLFDQLNVASRYAVHLVNNVSRTNLPLSNQTFLDALKEAQTRIAANINALLQRIGGDFRPEAKDLEDIRERLWRANRAYIESALEPDGETARLVDVLYYLTRLNQAIVAMAKEVN
jgi:uncharacterized membrane protein YccC